MPPDVILALGAAAEALDWVFSEEAFAGLLGLLGHGLGVGHVVVCDGGEQLLLVLPVKRRLTHLHIQKHTLLALFYIFTNVFGLKSPNLPQKSQFWSKQSQFHLKNVLKSTISSDSGGFLRVMLKLN